jgi:hypothetical protein
MDKELLLSAFHPDADFVYSRYGVLSPEQFFETHHKNQLERLNSQHWVSNLTIDLDGDTAHCESYFMGVLRNKGSEAVDIQGGRYLDKLERRSIGWRIAVRTSVPEWHVVHEGGHVSPTYGKTWAEITQGLYVGSRDRNDRSYERPLMPPHTH